MLLKFCELGPSSQSERGLDIAEGRTVGIASSVGGLRIVPNVEIMQCSDIHCHGNCIDGHVGAVPRRRPLPSSPARGSGAFVPCGRRLEAPASCGTGSELARASCRDGACPSVNMPAVASPLPQ